MAHDGAEVSRDWPGELVAIIAGGPSAASQDLSLLKARRVIVINGSWRSAPWADALFSMDSQFLLHTRGPLDLSFRGEIWTDNRRVAVSNWDRPRVLKRADPNVGVSADPREVAGFHTSLQGAINLAVHKGADRLVVLGADGGVTRGRRYHHGGYSWNLPSDYALMGQELEYTVAPLGRLGVRIVNCSPGTKWKFWPEAASLPAALRLLE